MSTKFSNLPTLDVAPTESWSGVGLFLGLTAALTTALLDLLLRGQGLLAAALLPVVIVALLSVWRGRSTGCRLRWHGGSWYYAGRSGVRWQPVRVQGLVLPYLVQLFISDSSRCWSCFIFHDSLDEETLKTLRRILLLQR